MEKLTGWADLWRELVEIRARDRMSEANGAPEEDFWLRWAQAFDENVRRRWATPDSTRDFVLSQLDADATVLDIGAGTGAWAGLFAQRVRRVTAVEPSPGMIRVMRAKLAEQGCSNVEIVQGAWPDVSVEAHDFSLSAHAMYSVPDLPAFIRRMVACTRRMCFLVLRAPTMDGVMADAARHTWGQPYDSANFPIAFNILLQMGIYPNVLMESIGLWRPRTSESLEAAMAYVKRRMGLSGSTEHDGFLADLLRRRLTYQDGQYIWPPGVQSALVYWSVARPASA